MKKELRTVIGCPRKIGSIQWVVLTPISKKSPTGPTFHGPKKPEYLNKLERNLLYRGSVGILHPIQFLDGQYILHFFGSGSSPKKKPTEAGKRQATASPLGFPRLEPRKMRFFEPMVLFFFFRRNFCEGFPYKGGMHLSPYLHRNYQFLVVYLNLI